MSSHSQLAAAPSPRWVLDAATGPLSAASSAALQAGLAQGWADPGRLHTEGRRARMMLDAAREQVAQLLGAQAAQVRFTHSGSDAQLAGLSGLIRGRRRVGATTVLGAAEHSVLLETAGAQAIHISVDHLGRVDLAEFTGAVAQPGVAAACLQTANPEVGTCQPVAAGLAAARAAKVPLLVDAGASLGRTPPPADFDVLTGDARSWGGPPGVGLLVIREGIRWRSAAPQSEPAVPLVMAAAAGLADATQAIPRRDVQCRELIDQIRAAAAGIPDTEVVGDPVDRLPHIVTCSSLFVDGEALVTELDRLGFAVASGSACGERTEPSHVLAAMGVLTHGNLRITLPLAPEPVGITEFTAALPRAIATVRDFMGTTGL